MIDWFKLISSSLWILGLSLMLSVFSYTDCPRDDAPRSLRSSLWATANNRLTWVSALLFCAGMGLTSGSILEGGLWSLLGLYGLYRLGRLSRSKLEEGPVSPPGADQEQRPGTSSVRGAGLRGAAEWLVRTELVWLALLASFLLLSAPLDLPTPLSLLVLLLIPLLWVARRIARGHFVRRTPLDWALALLLLMLLVSIYVAPDLALDKITNLLLSVAVYYGLVGWITSPSRLRLAVLTYALGGVGVALVGLLGTAWVDKLPMLTTVTAHLPTLLRGLSRAKQGFNPNITSGSLLWIIPLQVALAWYFWARQEGAAGVVGVRGRGWGLLLLRVALSLALVVSLGTLVLAQSRGALVGLVAGLLWLLWLAGRWGRLAVMAALVVAGGAAAYAGPLSLLDKLADAPGGASNLANGLFSTQVRIEIWARAIYGIEDFPLTGMGLHAFRKVQPILYPLFSGSPDTDIGHAHNQFLQAALDLGLPGLAAYFALWLLAVGMLVGIWRASGDGWVRACSAGLGACLLAYFSFGMTDVVALGDKRGVIFWAMLALLSALWRTT